MVVYGKMILRWAIILLLSGASQGVRAEESCWLGYDVGSSGIRVAMLDSGHSAKIALDFLSFVWRDNHLQAAIPATVEALQRLPREAGLPEGCVAVAGGYSAWRLAVARSGPAQVAETLQAIAGQSGVYFFIIPQDVEGGYGYQAVQRQMGNRLTTPIVLDIGGGSLQFAGAASGWGTDLGQKSWRKRVCQQIKQDPDPNCRPNPVGLQALPQGRDLLAAEVAAAQAVLGSGFTVSALSAPVTRSIYPILAHLSAQGLLAGSVDAQGFERTALASAFRLLATLDEEQLRQMLGQCQSNPLRKACEQPFLSTHVTDMLLLLLFMEGLDLQRMEVIEAEMNNVPGLLQDPRVRQWSKNYSCYLTRLRQHGVDAFKEESSHCPP
ncbi:MAG: hypothetical protein HQM06_15155 [Magnetococcales bacterium]|nr:hypothetical protein [Magnetococcales bacterium]